jgi:hypothetical protein
MEDQSTDSPATNRATVAPASADASRACCPVVTHSAERAAMELQPGRLYPGEVPEDARPMRDDLTAAVGARRELGPDYEDAVLDGFLARLDRQMQERVDATVAERLSSGERRAAGAPAGRDPGLTLGIVSVIAGIPVTAITMGTEELAGLIVAWGGIAAVNVAQAWGRRRRNAG